MCSQDILMGKESGAFQRRMIWFVLAKRAFMSEHPNRLTGDHRRATQEFACICEIIQIRCCTMQLLLLCYIWNSKVSCAWFLLSHLENCFQFNLNGVSCCFIMKLNAVSRGYM